MEHVYSLLKALFRDPKRLWMNPELWTKLVASPGISNTTLKMDVLLHYPDPRGCVQP